MNEGISLSVLAGKILSGSRLYRVFTSPGQPRAMAGDQ